MKMNRSRLILALAFFICSCHVFATTGNQIDVTLKLENDTVILSTNNFARYSITIKNIGHSPFKLKKDYLVCGYSKDESYSDYYLEMYEIKGKSKVRSPEYTQHYPIVEYYGEYAELSKGTQIDYKDITFHNQFKTKGTYIFRAVFYNKNAFIGKSNWVTVTVM